MNENQRAAYIISQSICAMAELMAMQAENAQREHSGESMAYRETDFVEVIDRYGLSHNSVLLYLHN